MTDKTGYVFIGGNGDVVLCTGLVIEMRDIIVRVEGYLEELKFKKLISFLKDRGYVYDPDYYEAWLNQFKNLSDLEYELETLIAFLDENDIPYEVVHSLFDGLGEEFA